MGDICGLWDGPFKTSLLGVASLRPPEYIPMILRPLALKNEISVCGAGKILPYDTPLHYWGMKATDSNVPGEHSITEPPWPSQLFLYLCQFLISE